MSPADQASTNRRPHIQQHMGSKPILDGFQKEKRHKTVWRGRGMVIGGVRVDKHCQNRLYTSQRTNFNDAESN